MPSGHAAEDDDLAAGALDLRADLDCAAVIAVAFIDVAHGTEEGGAHHNGGAGHALSHDFVAADIREV